MDPDPLPLPRKRKLPASLGLVPGGRANVVAASPPTYKRQHVNVRRSPVSAAAVSEQSGLSRAAASSSPSPSVHSIPSTSATHPPQVSVHTSAAASSSCMRFTQGSSQLSPSPESTLPLPPPFDGASAARVFPLLQLPSDVLSWLSGFFQPWEVFFMRCTCSTLRLVSGLNGGATGPPVLLRPGTRRPAHTPAATGTAGDVIADAADTFIDDAESTDETRFYHQWNSLDFRLLLCGWREFERQRARVVSESPLVHTSFSSSPLPSDVLDPSPDDSPTLVRRENSITIFDSDDEGDASTQEIGPAAAAAGTKSPPIPASSSVPTAASSSFSPVASSLPLSPTYRADVYDRLQRSIAPYLNGFPRIRPAAMAAAGSPSASSSARGMCEDLCTSSDEDVWLLHFLRTHRFPRIRYLHFAYVTLHSPLMHHLQAYCCAAPAIDDDSSGSFAHSSTRGVAPKGLVCELSVQYSDKSVGRWMDPLWRAFGPLRAFSLDLSPCQKSSVWASIQPLLPAVSATLQELQIIGPLVTSCSLPANIFDVLSASLPSLRVLLLAHGLLTSQSHILQASRHIRVDRRWRTLRSLTLLHFPLVEDLTPLLAALATPSTGGGGGEGQLETLHVQNCINLRMPIIEVPKRTAKDSDASSKKKKKNGGRDESLLPPRAAPRQSSDELLPLASVPCLRSLTSCTLSHCSSLTAPSLRSLPSLFPLLRSLLLNGYSSSLLGGTALRSLFDSVLTSCPYLTELHMAHAPLIDDHAWEALPKRTRTTQLRVLNLNVGRPAALARGGSGRVGVLAASSNLYQKSTSGGAARMSSPVDSKKALTDHGLNLLVAYCPGLRTLNLSGHVHLSPQALLRVITRLSCLQELTLLHINLDAEWITALMRLPIAHAMCVRISLSMPLLRSAPTLLSPPPVYVTPDTANSTSAEQPPALTRLHSAFTAHTANGGIARLKLAQQLQQHVADRTQRRVRMVVHV